MLCPCLLLAHPGQAGEPTREDRIRAAIVYKVGKFVDWPADAFATQQSLLEVCLLGPDAFAEALSSVGGRTLQGRQVGFRVVGPTELAELGACHILFLPRSASGRLGLVLASLSRKPVLTVSDIPGFARRGGMISLVRNGNRIGFEIDPQAASDAGLSLRAQLLDLAEIIDD